MPTKNDIAHACIALPFTAWVLMWCGVLVVTGTAIKAAGKAVSRAR